MPRLKFLSVCLLALLLAACGPLRTWKASHQPLRVQDVAEPVRVRDTAAGRARARAIETANAAAERLRLGDVAGAESDAKRALGIEPDNAVALNVLALIAMDRGNAQDAGRWFARAAQSPGARAAEWGNYGAWLCGANRANEALPWLDRALMQSGRDASADLLANRARCGILAGQPGEAEHWLRAALDADPNNTVALSTLAQWMLEHGKALEARAFSERRMAAGVPSETDLVLAARIERELGDESAAQRLDARRRQLFPSTSR